MNIVQCTLMNLQLFIYPIPVTFWFYMNLYSHILTYLFVVFPFPPPPSLKHQFLKCTSLVSQSLNTFKRLGSPNES